MYRLLFIKLLKHFSEEDMLLDYRFKELIKEAVMEDVEKENVV